MIDYDTEAEQYDATRGGSARAEAAATAITELLGPGTRNILDVACGTGSVGQMLAKHHYRVYGVDLSQAMLGWGSARLPGHIARGDARKLPIRTGTLDAVSTIWLLHLLDDAEPVIAEAARVLRTGGLFVTTVDKRPTAFFAGRPASDAAATVFGLAARHGLRPAGETTFVGVGQGRENDDPVYRLCAFSA